MYSDQLKLMEWGEVIKAIRILSSPFLERGGHTAAVSCSPDACLLGGAGLGIWLTGKLGHAWVGAWLMWCWGVHKGVFSPGKVEQR